jgi:hypothetical protein
VLSDNQIKNIFLRREGYITFSFYFLIKAVKPNEGPIAKIIKIKLESEFIFKILMTSILIMVIVNPIQFTMVKAVPFSFVGAFCATKVEKRGESAITTNPQKK